MSARGFFWLAYGLLLVALIALGFGAVRSAAILFAAAGVCALVVRVTG